MIVEICCGSYEDCLRAERGGAKRVELNSALFLGGLTPSIATVKKVLRNTSLEVIAMVRPRGAGFCYLESEIEVMMQDAEEMLRLGVDGLAFGFLNEDCTVDVDKTKAMVDLIHRYGKTAVFHRAIDCTVDYEASVCALIELGVDRILTSGQKEKAMDGADAIALIQKKYGDRLEVLPGSGVNAGNLKELIEKTGVSQAHSSCRHWENDPTTTGTGVTYAYHEAYDYDCVSEDLVRKLVTEAEKLG